MAEESEDLAVVGLVLYVIVTCTNKGEQSKLKKNKHVVILGDSWPEWLSMLIQQLPKNRQ